MAIHPVLARLVRATCHCLRTKFLCDEIWFHPRSWLDQQGIFLRWGVSPNPARYVSRHFLFSSCVDVVAGDIAIVPQSIRRRILALFTLRVEQQSETATPWALARSLWAPILFSVGVYMGPGQTSTSGRTPFARFGNNSMISDMMVAVSVRAYTHTCYVASYSFGLCMWIDHS